MKPAVLRPQRLAAIRWYPASRAISSQYPAASGTADQRSSAPAPKVDASAIRERLDRERIDLAHFVPRKTLSVRVHSLPGLREDLEIMLVPATRGGTQITIVTHLSGPLATGALVPRWVTSGVTARLLVRAAERARQLRLRDSSGVA